MPSASASIIGADDNDADDDDDVVWMMSAPASA
jgi:hypothetical protein